MLSHCGSVRIVPTPFLDCLERLVSEMTYYVLSSTLKPTHLLTHWTNLKRYLFRQCYPIAVLCNSDTFRGPGGLFTIGRTTSVRPTPVVRHPCDVEGYSRNMSHVRQPHVGRKFDRRSTTSTDMSYDL